MVSNTRALRKQERDEMIQAFQTVAVDVRVFRFIYQTPPFQDVIDSLEDAAGDLSEERLTSWAMSMRLGSSEAFEINDDLRVCAELLYQLCNYYEASSDIQFARDLVPIAHEVCELLLICLALQRVKCLIYMLYEGYTVRGMHWACKCCHKYTWERFEEIETRHEGFATLNRRLCKLVYKAILPNKTIEDNEKELLKRLTTPQATQFVQTNDEAQIELHHQPITETEFQSLEWRIGHAETCSEFLSIYQTSSFVDLMNKCLINWSQYRLDQNYSLDDWSSEWAEHVAWTPAREYEPNLTHTRDRTRPDPSENLDRAKYLFMFLLERLNALVAPEVIREQFKARRVVNICQRVLPMARAVALLNERRWSPPPFLVALTRDLRLDEKNSQLRLWLQPIDLDDDETSVETLPDMDTSSGSSRAFSEL